MHISNQSGSRNLSTWRLKSCGLLDRGLTQSERRQDYSVRPIGPRSYAVRTPSGLLSEAYRTEVRTPSGLLSEACRTEVRSPSGLIRRNRRHLNRRRSTPPSHPRFNPAVPSTLPGPVEDNFQMDLDPAPVKPQVTTTQSASPLPPTPSAATSHPEQATTRSGRVVKAPQKLYL